MSNRIYLSSPHMGPDEKKLLLDAFDSNWIAPAGPHLDLFEKEFSEKIQISNSVGLVNGTSGLHLALVLLGVGPGDEILTSDLTFAATVNVMYYLGAKPTFIDSDHKSWNMDPLLLEEELVRRAKINKLPKVVMVVDLYGQSADMDPILEVCSRWNIPVIEDAAEVLGATYKDRAAGTSGTINVFSFNGNKIITTSSGGMLVSNDKSLTDRARFLSTQAKDSAPHYQHSSVGYNYRLSNLLAAIGRGQLKVLDQRVVSRRANFDYYYKELNNLPGIKFMPEASYGKSTRWLTCLTIDPKLFGSDREDIRLALEKQNIESRPVWKPMHLQPIFSSCHMVGGSVSEELFKNGLCLPSGSNLTLQDLEKTVAILKNCNK